MKKPSNWILDHIAYSCYDFKEISELYCSLFGYEINEEEELEDQGIKVRFLSSKEQNLPMIELLSPVNEKAVIFKSLKSRGPGFHHICFKVNDMTSAIKEARNYGLELISGYPIKGSRNKDIAFFYPNKTGSVLTEICSY